MNHFFAYMSRLRLIRRWSLMRNTQPENDAEHSLQVAMMAHGIALIARDRYGKDIDPEHVVTLAVYHDAAEVLTGDLPTPVKYHSQELRSAFSEVEDQAVARLAAMLPEDLRADVASCMTEKDTYAARLVKAADRISAYAKCIEEQRAGNHEFDAAAIAIRKSIDAIDLPEVQEFMRDMMPAFALTLDELNGAEVAK
ncbi:MAG: 5'-deoxynucleotidase [Clostridia bacterium]|nr:5'-deoxynucleotidase [Clostridia bacterium]MBR2287925.1 5'-deoxynucleotidase [Clostridia bacterium]